jgi:hypothetical protein
MIDTIANLTQTNGGGLLADATMSAAATRTAPIGEKITAATAVELQLRA